MKRYEAFLNHYCLAILALLVSAVWCEAQQDQNDSANQKDSVTGISLTKPESGRFVKIEGGYMVPYEQIIPGTNIKYKMEPIPGGRFLMGSPKSDDLSRADEHPQVEIVIQPFWMGKYEVTWKEYKKFIRLNSTFRKFKDYRFRLVSDESVDAVTIPSQLYDPALVFSAGDGDDEPCAMMTPFAAKQYTKYISLLTKDFHRLPTEAEWEYACRAGTKTRFYFGDSADALSDHAWFYDNSDDLRQTVGLKKPNPWGLHDMYGNVAEWVLDEYLEDVYSILKGGEDAIEAHVYPSKYFGRVSRGGSFELDPEDCRSAARMQSSRDWSDEDPDYPMSPWWHTSSPSVGVGFRLMRPLNAPKTQEDKELFWEPPEIVADAVRRRLDDSGRGATGRISPKLFEVIEKFEKLRGK